jgi:hypothetical protein
MFKRPPEKMEDTKIVKFGEAKLRSPSPVRGASVTKSFPERKVSAPPTMNYSPLPYNMNGNSDMLNFMNLLEREESDFVDQVKKSKAFIQSVIRQAATWHLCSDSHRRQDISSVRIWFGSLYGMVVQTCT